MSTAVTKTGGNGVPVMQTIAGLLTMVMEHTDDLKGVVCEQSSPYVASPLPAIQFVSHQDE